MRPLVSFLRHPRRPSALTWLVLGAWLLCVLLWGGWLIREQMRQTREDFETNSRILHRLLTQRAEQHDAVLAASIALEPALEGMPTGALKSFVSSVIAAYPQITTLQRYVSDDAGTWRAFLSATRLAPELPALLQAAVRDGQALMPVADGFVLVRRGGAHSVWLLVIRNERLLAEDEQVPAGIDLRLAPDDGPPLWLHPASPRVGTSLAPLHFEKHLAVRSQPWLMTTEQAPLPARLPWLRFGIGAIVLLSLCLASGWAFGEYRKRVLAQRQLALAHASRINAMGEVAAGMAHELNQPLAAILSSVQALGRWLDDDPPDVANARDAASAAAKQARRAGEILQRLRSFISPQEQAGGAVDLNDVAMSAASLVGETLQRRKVDVEMKLVDVLPAVTGQRVAFEQVVVNLLLNAADAIEQTGSTQRRIRIETKMHDKCVELSISDSGPGLTEEVKARLFEPFFTTKQEGMGLGLSICENIVQQAGGDLLADNAPGGGAVFRVQLPARAGREESIS